ncbi:uncharacterized protein NDAI_0G02340 [Naumovozyma dairenensis CBS 421]|uniref:Uncharacterized protein n=1 Tax=Naumovozyma dairenensis (strain ATCC 10597 / BCRC 20456 / CBS 421 / NBRC 0211 / NRRL Y-12639) TaxID=1071378 RepID=G0WDZ8_NAUDC|nr:hypothetical protein NDAI_0G02340 [Naumovozyma dairenensis CBS 421]CCD26009.2 hypothetical protein NDAI_0G02340 [Naumovozyma dairenensis CBS 421]
MEMSKYILDTDIVLSLQFKSTIKMKFQELKAAGSIFIGMESDDWLSNSKNEYSSVTFNMVGKGVKNIALTVDLFSVKNKSKARHSVLLQSTIEKYKAHGLLSSVTTDNCSQVLGAGNVLKKDHMCVNFRESIGCLAHQLALFTNDFINAITCAFSGVLDDEINRYLKEENDNEEVSPELESETDGEDLAIDEQEDIIEDVEESVTTIRNQEISKEEQEKMKNYEHLGDTIMKSDEYRSPSPFHKFKISDLMMVPY